MHVWIQILPLFDHSFFCSFSVFNFRSHSAGNLLAALGIVHHGKYHFISSCMYIFGSWRSLLRYFILHAILSDFHIKLFPNVLFEEFYNRFILLALFTYFSCKMKFIEMLILTDLNIHKIVAQYSYSNVTRQ